MFAENRVCLLLFFQGFNSAKPFIKYNGGANQGNELDEISPGAVNGKTVVSNVEKEEDDGEKDGNKGKESNDKEVFAEGNISHDDAICTDAAAVENGH